MLSQGIRSVDSDSVVRQFFVPAYCGSWTSILVSPSSIARISKTSELNTLRPRTVRTSVSIVACVVENVVRPQQEVI